MSDEEPYKPTMEEIQGAILLTLLKIKDYLYIIAASQGYDESTSYKADRAAQTLKDMHENNDLALGGNP